MSTKKLQILGSIGGNVEVDATLAQEGKAADSKAVGDAILAHENNTDIHITEEDRAFLLGVIDSIHGHSNKDVLDQIASTVDIYTDETEPANAKDGSVWINMTSTSGAPTIYVCRNGVWEISADGKPQIQADWDESDGLAPSYIRNKPFGYKDDLYANSAQSFSLFRNSIYRSVPDGDGIPNVYGNGDEITVIWDSIVYNLVAKEATIVIAGGGSLTIYNVLGNSSILIDAYNGIEPGVDSGEPFAIVAGENGIYTRSSLASHSIVIKDATNVIKLDPKFLPDEALFVQSDWNETDENNGAFIKNKPTIPDEYIHPDTHPASMITGLSAVATSGSYNDLADKPTVEQIQADWTETDESSPAYIKNKPESLGAGEVSWNDLTDKPFYDGEKTVVVETAEILFINDGYAGESGGYPSSIASPAPVRYLDLVDGTSYVVVYDGDEYSSRVATNNKGTLFIGGEGGYDCSVTEAQPFYFEMNSDGTMLIRSYTEGSHTVGLYTPGEIKTLDEKYIPDTIARVSDIVDDADLVYVDSIAPTDAPDGSLWVDTSNDNGTGTFTLSGVPVITAEDEGKMIQVIDGAYVLVSVAESSIAAYIDSYINEALGGDY